MNYGSEILLQDRPYIRCAALTLRKVKWNSYLSFQLQGTYIVGTRKHSSSTKDLFPHPKVAHPKVVDSSDAVGAARMHVPPTS